MLSIIVYVPATHAEAVRTALAAAGAGAAGAYDSCSFSCAGEGRFRPLKGAIPAFGAVGELAVVAEERIEATVPEAAVAAVVAAVRAAHPYEEPAIHLSQVVDWRAFVAAPAQTVAAAAALVPSPPPRALPVSIVVEGLDGVGKSTLVEALAARLHAVAMSSPPASMRGFRPHFDGLDGAERRAFYSVANFVAGADMERGVQAGRTVVMDRYFATTVAYQLAQSEAPLPPPGNVAYAWPALLPRPMHMVLLTLPEPDRLARRAARTAVAETGEEAELRRRPDVPLAINEAYRRLGCTEVALAADDGVEAAVDKVLAALGLKSVP
jgi:thymidylate kinase